MREFIFELTGQMAEEIKHTLLNTDQCEASMNLFTHLKIEPKSTNPNYRMVNNLKVLKS